MNEESSNLDFLLETFIVMTITLFVVSTAFFFTNIFQNTGHASAEPNLEMVEEGKKLVESKGCLVCHSLNGNPLIGPTFQGIYERETIVLTDEKERTIKADESYIKSSILEPNQDVVKGYAKGLMILTSPVSPEEADKIVTYLKTQ